MTSSQYQDGTYHAKNPSWHEGDAPWKAKLVRSMVPDAPSSVVDVGCGTGGVLAVLRRSWPSTQLVGYDISPNAISHREEAMAASGLDLRIGTVNSIEQRFSLGLALDVFEHVPDYMGFLLEMAKVAEQFVFHIPLDLSAQTILRSSPLLSARSRIGHLHYFSKETALATLADTEYEVLAHRLIAADAQESNRWLQSKVALVPRRALAALAGDGITARTLGGYTLLVLAVNASH